MGARTPTCSTTRRSPAQEEPPRARSTIFSSHPRTNFQQNDGCACLVPLWHQAKADGATLQGHPPRVRRPEPVALACGRRSSPPQISISSVADPAVLETQVPGAPPAPPLLVLHRLDNPSRPTRSPQRPAAAPCPRPRHKKPPPRAQTVVFRARSRGVHPRLVSWCDCQRTRQAGGGARAGPQGPH